MHLALDELDRRLAALDEAIAMFRADHTKREALLVAFAPAASSILERAGPHRDYVERRLQAILVANGMSYSPGANATAGTL